MITSEDIFEIKNLAPGVHAITELDHVHTYLVEGADWALLIDSGLGIGNIKTAVESITSRPVIVVNTHAHWDHTGGNHLFDTIAIHPDEAKQLEAGIPAEVMNGYFRDNPEDIPPFPHGMNPADFNIKPSRASHLVSHGEAIDLGGGRVLEVLHTPGHTPGSICLLDEINRMLFTGDTLYTGLLYAHLDESDLSRYAETARMLYGAGWDVNLVFPSHNETPLDGGILLEMGSGFDRLMDGEGMYRTAQWRGKTVYDVSLGRFSVRISESLRNE